MARRRLTVKPGIFGLCLSERDPQRHIRKVPTAETIREAQLFQSHMLTHSRTHFKWCHRLMSRFNVLGVFSSSFGAALTGWQGTMILSWHID